MAYQRGFAGERNILMEVDTLRLENGLRVIHYPFPSEISYCGIAINTGTRDEYPGESGMAHFVEHMLFKGTNKRKAHHIANRMENVGGDLNAYTTKEETFVYATFLKEYFPRAVELLSDIFFNSEFSQQQINRERDVILDEISSYADSPVDLIFDDFENLIFDGSEIGHYTLGEPATLNSFNREDFTRFVKREYRLSETVFFSFGKTPFSKVSRLVEKYFSFSQDEPAGKPRLSPEIGTPVSKVIEKNTTQSHVILGWKTVDMFHEKKYPLFLLNSILGGGSMNSRLNGSLREKNGLVYHVESSLSLYTDTGFLAIYFACDPKSLDKCTRLIQKEIKKIKEAELTPMQLAAAKRQLKGQLGIAFESNEYNALSMAKSYLHLNRFIPLEERFNRIDEVGPLQVNEIANELFSTSPFSLLYV